MTLLVTGSTGFLDFHLCKKLLQNGISLLRFDNLNNYYDVNLKKERLKQLNIISKK